MNNEPASFYYMFLQREFQRSFFIVFYLNNLKKSLKELDVNNLTTRLPIKKDENSETTVRNVKLYVSFIFIFLYNCKLLSFFSNHFKSH